MIEEGLLTTFRSFLGQCPPTFLAIILTWLLVPNQTVNSGTGNMRRKFLRVDFAGAFLIASTILVFLLPLELAGDRFPWNHPLIIGLLGLSFVLGILFIVVEVYWATEPILPPHVFASPNVIVPNSLMLFQTAAQLGVSNYQNPDHYGISRLKLTYPTQMMYTVPLYFQITANASSTSAGARLFPAVAGVAIGGLLGGYSIKR
jgi:Fungal trichothecene efflux pump (TRI12)